MRHPIAASLVAASLLAAGSTARADDVVFTTGVRPAPPFDAPAPKPRDATEWYGWENLATDGASVAGIVGGIAIGSAPLGIAGVTTYAVGGPIVHFAHGRVETGFASLALRVGAPIVLGVGGLTVGAIAGAATERNVYDATTPDTRAGDAAAVGGVIGFFTGVVLASALDSAVLAHEKVKVDPDGEAREGAAAAKPSSSFAWAPNVTPTKGGGLMAGIGGTF